MLIAGVLLAALVLQTPDSPAAVVQGAARAIQGDSAAALADGWRLRLARDSSDPAALLGLATVALLEERRLEAAAMFTRLAAHAPPAWRAAAWIGLGRIAVIDGDADRADSLYRLAAAAPAADPATRADGLIDLAIGVLHRHDRMDDPLVLDSVGRMLEQALRLAPADAPAIRGTALCRRAELEIAARRGDPVASARAGVALTREGGDARREGICLYYLARSYLPRGGMDSAIAVLGRAAEASERGRDRFALALTLYIRGHLHTINSDYGLARADQFRALALARASGNGYALARASLNLSRIALLFGDYTAALRYAAETDSVLQHRTDPFIAVTLADVLGNIARARGDPAAAREAYQRALSQSVRLGPPWPAFQRRYLAALARDAGDWAGARRELDAARRDALAANMGAWDAELEYDFGVLALLEGNLDQARRSFQRFLETLPPEDQARRYLAGMRLAVVALKQGRVDEAETRARAAAEAFDDWRASLGDRELRALVFELREGDLDLTSASAAVVAGLARAGRVPSAFALAERRRARDLLDRLVELQALGRTAAVPGGTPGAGAWGAAAADTIAASLPDDHTALLEFIAGERGTPTTLFVLTRTRLTAFELPSIDRLGPELARFSALVESGQEAPALGRRLGRILLDSAMAVLGGGIDRLLIIPDGPLHRIDFELLRPGDRLLLESHEVSVVPSGAVLVQLRRRPRNERPLEVLAVGDPDLPERTADSAGAGVAAYLTAFADAGGLERLPASGREARFAASLAPRSVVLLRAGASEARFKRESLARYRLIHLATHAVVDEASLARTALALAPGDGEDGFLGPGELADLHFDADLIVLSGCRTAGGVIVRGEGILGLTATLLAAGGRSVLATRWAVGDRAVAAFLQRFYRAMARGATAGGALREARLAARASGVPATDWAAFELVGDPGIRLPLREPRPPWWLWAGGGVVALVLWMVIRRARRPTRAGAGPAREAAA